MTASELIFETERKLGPPPRHLGFDEQFFSIADEYGREMRRRDSACRGVLIIEVTAGSRQSFARRRRLK